MSTIKVDTITTRTGSGDIAISNNVTSLTTSALTATKIHPSSGTTTNYLSLDSSNELNFKNASNVSQTLFINYDGGGVHLARGSISVEADGSGTGNSVFGGNIRFSTAGKGIYLGTTGTTAANLLDDYEEGTWTAKLSDGTTDVDLTTSAVYTKIGNLVTVSFDKYNVSISSLNTSDLTIKTLPFASNANSHGNKIIHVTGTSGGANTPVVVYPVSGSTSLALYKAVSSSQNMAQLTSTALASSISIRLTLTYFTDS